MNIDPADPKKADRDKFILSKGHAGPVQYAALAERGYFPVEDMMKMCIRDSSSTGSMEVKTSSTDCKNYGSPGVLFFEI